MFLRRNNQRIKLSISAIVFILLFNCGFVQARDHEQHLSKMKACHASRAQSAKSSKASSSCGGRILKGSTKSKSPAAINFGPGPGAQLANNPSILLDDGTSKANVAKTLVPYTSRAQRKTEK
jgi:hypothetical protein